MDPVDLLRSMLLVRAFEDVLASRPDRGFQLFSAGEEAVAAGVCAALLPQDQLLASGRSIGPALARGLDPGAVLAEILGKSAGPCRGKGGRGHLAMPASGFFGAHAVVGGNLSIAAGVALAAQLRGERAIVACIFGDGACGSGALHETLNVAALWNLPLLFICNNNQYSVSTARSQALAPRALSDIARPFGISSMTLDGMDAIAVAEAARRFAERARAGGGPSFLECVSYRFSSHSTATRESRPPKEIEAARERCPIRRLASRLEDDGVLSRDGREQLERDAEAIVARAVLFAEASPYPDPSEIERDVV